MEQAVFLVTGGLAAAGCHSILTAELLRNMWDRGNYFHYSRTKAGPNPAMIPCAPAMPPTSDVSPPDELMEWELRVAQRADQLAAKNSGGREQDLEYWLQAEREVLAQLPLSTTGLGAHGN
jgi:hypothetical protein